MRLASWRAGFRLAGVAVHLAAGVAIVAAVYPWVGLPTRRRLKQRWSARLLARLGVELRADGAPGAGVLVAANHVSWLDIFVINAVCPAAFVCKDDVRNWPLIGWLCARTETLFIARGRSRDAREIGGRIAGLLADGACVAFFPEGTTTDGTHLLPFRSALFQPAIDLPARVQPALIRYVAESGETSPAPVYVGETTLLESLRRIAAAPRTLAVLAVGPAVEPQGMNRRELSGYVETHLRDHLRRPPPGLREEADAGFAAPQAAAEAG